LIVAWVAANRLEVSSIYFVYCILQVFNVNKFLDQG
jgi:hypothetical protein